MSDVSSMFIVYLLELQTWHPDTNVTSAVLQDLWPHAKLAAEWHMNISITDKLPNHLETTYDILGLSGYKYSTYSSAFHLLAMLAAERLAYQMGKCTFVNLLPIANKEPRGIPNRVCSMETHIILLCVHVGGVPLYSTACGFIVCS